MYQPSLRARMGIIGLTLGGVLLALLLAGYGLASAAAAGVQLQPASAAASGLRGQSITYTLQVTNTGSLPDIMTMTVTGNSWPTDMYIVPGTILIPNTKILVALNAGQGRAVQVVVHIPTDALGHDVATITARSTNAPGASATAALTTSVFFKLYLPLIQK